jgi:hypothetical protein
MPMHSRCCFSETISMWRPRSTDGTALPMTLNLNGHHRRVGH